MMQTLIVTVEEDSKVGGGRTIRRKREEGGTGERIWTSQFLVYENALLLTKYQKLTTIIAA